MAKGDDKLIRQLSLVSYLLTLGRPATAAEIHASVEGYPTMSEETFTRRFHGDRAELHESGIDIEVHPEPEGDRELYSLPEENFYLPELELSPEEVRSLSVALNLLEGSFPYVRPLRLALAGLTHGHPDAGARSLAAAGVRLPDDEEALVRGPQLARLEDAVARRKRVSFEYYAAHRDSTEQRVLDPYGLFRLGGHWYVVGHDRERDAERMFRLSRITGKVEFATKRPRDFDVPETYDVERYFDRPPWLLDDPVGVAVVEVDPELAWLVERSVHQARRVSPVRSASVSPGSGADSDPDGVDDAGASGLDGSGAGGADGTDTGALDGSAAGESPARFELPYADPGALLAWVLEFGRRAELVHPAALRRELAATLGLIASHHEGPAKGAAGDSRTDDPAASEGGGGPGVTAQKAQATGVIPPDRLSRVLGLLHYLLDPERGDAVPVSTAAADLGLTAREIEDDLGLLNLVNHGGGTYLIYASLEHGTISVSRETLSEAHARPARLSPQMAQALRLALDLLEHAMAGQGLASLGSVREKLEAALGDRGEPGRTALVDTVAADSGLLEVLRGAIADRLVVRLEYYTSSRDVLSSREVEPHLLVHGGPGWYLAAYCRAAEDARTFRVDRIRRAEPTGERFEPRDESWDPDPARPESWGRASRARVRFPERRRRLLTEEGFPVEAEPGGFVVAEIPYADESWLVRQILAYRGEAILLEPAPVRGRVAEEARLLLGLYREAGESG